MTDAAPGAFASSQTCSVSPSLPVGTRILVDERVVRGRLRIGGNTKVL
jgi:hypothetical protein